VFETPLFEWAGRSFGISRSTQLNSDLTAVKGDLRYLTTDLNTLPSSIKFFVFHSTSIGAPGLNAGLGIQFYYDANFRVQVATEYGTNNKLWIRQTYKGVFTEWSKIALS